MVYMYLSITRVSIFVPGERCWVLSFHILRSLRIVDVTFVSPISRFFIPEGVNLSVTQATLHDPCA